jgi:hypothetical protein
MEEPYHEYFGDAVDNFSKGQMFFTSLIVAIQIVNIWLQAYVFDGFVDYINIMG